MEWSKIILDNTVLLINVASVEVGLLAGMGLRAWVVDKLPSTFSDYLKTFGLFSLILAYSATVATFSNWPIPAIGYAILGIVSVPLSVPAYKLLIANAPALIMAFIPQGALKWLLENSKPKQPQPAPSEEQQRTKEKIDG